MPREVLVQSGQPTTPINPTLWVDLDTPAPMGTPSIPVFATAAARDTTWPNPYNGAMCVTTDTNTVWQRIAGVWVPRGGGLGRVGYVESTTDQQFATAGLANITALVLSYTPVAANRRIRAKMIILAGLAGGTGAGATQLNLAVDGTDQAESMIVSHPAGPFNTQVVFDRVFTLSAAAHTFQARGADTVAGVFFQFGWLELIDDGP